MLTFKRNRLSNKGFTLVELVVVVGIIGILATIIFASFSSARQISRDKARLADLTNLKQGIELYMQENASLLNYPNGTNIGRGGAIDNELKSSLAKTPADPLNTGSSAYYYDSSFTCSGSNKVVVAALTMERSGAGNFQSVCGTPSAPFSANSFVIVIN
jgi:prepilin-type N-terminal cleavage/methylation domain-containing protein